MIATLTELFAWCQDPPRAVGSFTATTREDMLGVVDAAEALDAPVILQASVNQLAGPGIGVWAAEAVAIARDARVPVCLHLDHGHDYDICLQALRHGFTSVMRDASKLPLERNIAEVAAVTRAAHAVGVPVEAELGQVGGIEDGVVTGTDGIYTDPDEAERMVTETGVDALAVAIGTAHGLYQGPVVLDFERAEHLGRLLPVPLVLHGGSGVDDASLARLVRAGVAKVNIGTEIKHAQVDAWQAFLAGKPRDRDPRHALTRVREAVRAVADAKIRALQPAPVAG